LAKPSRQPLVTATTTASLDGPCRFKWAPAFGPALADRCVWSQFFEPHLVAVVQATFVIVDACPERSDRNTVAETCMAFTRVSALLVYRSHARDGRDPSGHGSRPEQPQLNPASTAENGSCFGFARPYCTAEASRQKNTMTGST
jgi:hypothetical protein